MATKTFKGRIQNKHDTEANWNAAVNFKPLAGELIIYDEDNTHSTPRFKVGDGNTLVSNLPFVSADFAKLNKENNFTDTNIFTSKNYFGYKTYLGTPEDNVAELSFKDDTTNYPTPEKAYIRTVIQAGAEYNGKPTIDFVNTEGGSSHDMIALTKWDKPSEHYYRTALENFVSPNPGTGHAAVIAHYELGGGDTVAPINEYRAEFPLKSGTVALTSDLPVANSGTGTTALTSLEIEDTIYTIPSGDVTAAGNNTFTGTNTFNNSTGTEFCTSVKAFSASAPLSFIKVTSNNFIKSNMTGSSSSVQYTMSLPDKDGTIALTSDIPDVATFAKLAQDNTFTGMTNTFTNQVNLQGLVRIGKGNSITNLSSTSTGLINVKLPSKAGTLALTSDIPIKSATLNGTTLSITLS